MSLSSSVSNASLNVAKITFSDGTSQVSSFNADSFLLLGHFTSNYATATIPLVKGGIANTVSLPAPDGLVYGDRYITTWNISIKNTSGATNGVLTLKNNNSQNDIFNQLAAFPVPFGELYQYSFQEVYQYLSPATTVSIEIYVTDATAATYRVELISATLIPIPPGY